MLFQKLKKVYLLARRSLQKNVHKISLAGGIFLSCILILTALVPYIIPSKNNKGVLGANISKIQSTARKALAKPLVEVTTVPPTKTPTPTPSPTLTPTINPTPTQKLSDPTPTLSQDPKYTAERIDDTTWRVSNVDTDDRMANSQEIVNALNSYRQSHGKSTLEVDDYLSSYAQERANTFASGGLDGHAGFKSFMDNDGFSKAGFNSLGENSAIVSGPMNGDKIIRQIFGADPPHDSNQLDDWTHVGVGVNGNAVNVNFGKGKR